MWPATGDTTSPEEGVTATGTVARDMEVVRAEVSEEVPVMDVDITPGAATTTDTTGKVTVEVAEDSTLEAEEVVDRDTGRPCEEDKVVGMHSGLVNETSNMKTTGTAIE